jgi:hypothetical protein
MKKKTLFILIAIVILLILSIVGFFVIKEEFSQKLIIENNSGTEITTIEIKYANKVLGIDNIGIGEKIVENIESNIDGDFDIKVTFNTGQILIKDNFGYITNLDGSKSFITIRSTDNIEFKQSY